MMNTCVHVKVPATSANLGPGFDSLGLALSLYNEVYFWTDDTAKGITVTVTGEGKGIETLPAEENLVVKSIQSALVATGNTLPRGGRLHLVNRIPFKRGLGSSSAAIVGGLLVGNQLAGNTLRKNQLLALATEIEGHPDNVAPALFGGLTVSIMVDQKPLTHTLRLPQELQFVVVIPEIEIETETARKILPAQVDRQTAIYNMGRIGYLLSSLWLHQYDQLQEAMQDKIHVPYRLPLIRGGKEALQAALAAGAHGATISGSGSTLLAVATTKTQEIARAMTEAFASQQVAVQTHILSGVDTGASGVIEEKP